MDERQQSWAVVSECLQGNQEALDFLFHFNRVVNVWDDLVDGDIAGQHPFVSKGFESALVHIPRNAFYQAYRHELQPLIEMTIANWHAANEFQTTGNDELVARAHMLRFDGLNVFLMCARLIGGQDWANQCAPRLRAAIPSESLTDFVQEMKQCP